MALYHQIFVKETFDTEAKIALLKPFMYDGKNNEKTEVKVENMKVKEKDNETMTKQTDVFYPDKKDTLFWCLYIANNEMVGYESIGHGFSNIEIAEKQKVTNFIKAQPSRIKNTNNKITNITIQEIMSDIITNKTLSISTLIAMAVFYKKRIILTKNDKFYIDICPTDDIEDTIVLNKNARGEYGLDTSDRVKFIEENMFRLDRYDRPLSAVSSYSMDELKEISRKVGFNVTAKCKKAELYQELTRYCLW
jgi:hypothetical protein